MAGRRLKLDLLPANASIKSLRDAGCGDRRDARRWPWSMRLLVWEEQGLLALRHAAGLGLAGQSHARLDEIWRRPGALQRARPTDSRTRSRRVPYGPDADATARLVQAPIESADELKGLKYRTVGLSADLFNELGAAVTVMGGGEIVPAMDRGLLGQAEFSPSSIACWVSRCEQSVHAAELSPVGRSVRGHLQQDKILRNTLPPELQAI